MHRAHDGTAQSCSAGGGHVLQAERWVSDVLRGFWADKKDRTGTKGDCDLQVCRATSARCDAMRCGQARSSWEACSVRARRCEIKAPSAGCAHMTGCCWPRRRASFRARCGACARRSVRSFVRAGLAVEKEELAQPPVTITAPCRHSSSTK